MPKGSKRMLQDDSVPTVGGKLKRNSGENKITKEPTVTMLQNSKLQNKQSVTGEATGTTGVNANRNATRKTSRVRRQIKFENGERVVVTS